MKFDPTLPHDESEQDTDLKLIQVKETRSPKQETVLKALLEHGVPKPTREIEIDPALDHLLEENGEDYTTKAFLWQVAGEFIAVVQR